jgi:hypothetical protein
VKTSTLAIVDIPGQHQDQPQPPALTLPELQQQIAHVRQQIDNLPIMRSPHEIEQEIQHTAARCLIDPSLKSQLADLIGAKHDAENILLERQRLNGQLGRLQSSLSMAEADERKHQAQSASQTLDIVIEEYYAAAKQACRAYRRMLLVRQRNFGVKGAATQVPAGPNFPHLVPYGWQGTTADHIAQNSLPWLNEETQ